MDRGQPQHGGAIDRQAAPKGDRPAVQLPFAVGAIDDPPTSRCRAHHRRQAERRHEGRQRCQRQPAHLQSIASGPIHPDWTLPYPKIRRPTQCQLIASPLGEGWVRAVVIENRHYDLSLPTLPHPRPRRPGGEALEIASLVEPGLIRRVEQGDDVLRRDAGLDVVDVVEDVAAAGLPGGQIAGDVLRGPLPARRWAGRAGCRSPRPRTPSGRRSGPSTPPGPCPSR